MARQIQMNCRRRMIHWNQTPKIELVVTLSMSEQMFWYFQYFQYFQCLGGVDDVENLWST